MSACTDCGYQSAPDDLFCASCGSRFDQAQVVAPDGTREYYKPPLTIGGWSFFDKVRFRWGGGGDIVFGISLIGGGHSAGTTVFGLLLIALGIITWVITQFGVRGRQEFDNDWYSAWNSLSVGGRLVAGTGSVIGMLFLYLLFFWLFLILWVIRIIVD